MKGQKVKTDSDEKENDILKVSYRDMVHKPEEFLPIAVSADSRSVKHA